MLRKILGVAAALALPVLLVAQTPGTPNTNASATAKEKAALPQGKATHRRGDVVTSEDKDRDRDDRAKQEDKDRDRDERPKNEDKDRDRDDRTTARNPNAATPAVPAHKGGTGATQSGNPKAATPAVPSPKSGGHRRP
jgi:hypothetical protein